MTLFDDPLTTLAALPAFVVPLAVFASSVLEYVFPPFWGDTFILIGFFLAGQGGASAVAVFVAAVLGGLVGGLIAYGLGHRYGLRAMRRFTFQQRPSRTRDRIRRLYARFGERVLLLNRFLPVIRGLLHYAAGAMRLRLRPVVIYSSLGNVAWVALLMGVGLLTGGTWEQIEQSFKQYSRGLGIIALAAVGVWLGWVLWRATRLRTAPRD